MNRLRLSGAYVGIMLAGLLLFAAAAVFAIDRAQRSTLDSRLQTAARAAEQFIDVRKGEISMDASDREQVSAVVAPDADAAVLDRFGNVLYSSASRVNRGLQRSYGMQSQAFYAGSGDAQVRVFVLPVIRGGVRAGAVVVWSGSDWIDETDRNLAIALGAGALLIAGLALLAGNVVTKRALEDAFERQRRFTADASHELRTPLAVIRAESDLALRKDREVAQYRSTLQTIASEADRMEALIGELLLAARAESGTLSPERIDVEGLLSSVAARLAPAAAAKETSIRLHGGEGAVIVADRRAVERALLAIAHNAVRHAPAGGEIVFQTRILDHTIEISVQDNGPGFTAQALEHGLERFWREPGAPAGTGSGLGLAIARSVIEANRGSIVLANAPKGGAVVRMRFPAA